MEDYKLRFEFGDGTSKELQIATYRECLELFCVLIRCEYKENIIIKLLNGDREIQKFVNWEVEEE